MVISLRVFLFKPNLADAQHAGMIEQRGNQLDHLAAQRHVLGFLGVDAEPAIVVDAVAGGALGLDFHQVAEIVGEAGGAGPVIPGPERRLGNRHHAAPGHVLVIVGGSADAMDVGVDVFHESLGNSRAGRGQ